MGSRAALPLSTGAGRFPISQGLAWALALQKAHRRINAFGQAQVAQLVEQRIENPRVGGSNPPLGTTFPFATDLTRPG